MSKRPDDRRSFKGFARDTVRPTHRDVAEGTTPRDDRPPGPRR